MILTEFDRYMQRLCISDIPREVVFSKETYRTDEYRKLIEPFIQEARELDDIVERYKTDYEAVYNRLRSTVVRKEHGKGAQFLNLGYFDPDPVEEVVVVNAKRGKLLKRITKTTKPDAEYGFDAAGRLVTIETIEYERNMFGNRTAIIYEEDIIIAIEFSMWKERHSLTKIVLYKYQNGLLNKEICGYIDHSPDRIMLHEATIKEYLYTEQKISERVHTAVVLKARFLDYPTHVDRHAHRFACNEQGQIVNLGHSWDNGKPLRK